MNISYPILYYAVVMIYGSTIYAHGSNESVILCIIYYAIILVCITSYGINLFVLYIDHSLFTLIYSGYTIINYMSDILGIHVYHMLHIKSQISFLVSFVYSGMEAMVYPVLCLI